MSYFLYARKSTDSEDRQVLSIEAQRTEVREFAKKEGLTIVAEFTESMTAKEPGRPVFNEMLSRIENGEAKGIIAWNPDRLARNSIDGGRIIYFVDTGKIKDLKFPTFRFDNNAYGKFILSIAFGQSKYYSDNLSENIRRGIRQKLRKGIWPQWAPLGYLNDHKTKTIIIDKEKASFIKKAFELYATGNYSIKTLRTILYEKGLTGRKDRPLSTSNVQYLLKNPVYCGVIRYSGETYEGSHPPIITKQLFDKVQKVLIQRHRATRKKRYNYPFRGFIKCDECGAMITAEIKKKRYIYYHCTKRKGKCSQPYNLTEENLAGQITSALAKIWLNNKTTNMILADFEQHRYKEDKNLSCESIKLEKELTVIEQKLDRLLEGYINGWVSPAEYQAKKQKLVEAKVEIRQYLDGLKNKSLEWLELAKGIILTCNSVGKDIKEPNYENLAQICQKTGSNFVLKDKILSFSFREPFEFISKNKSSSFFPTTKIKTSCPPTFPSAEGEPLDFLVLFAREGLCRSWRRDWDSNPG